MDIIKQSEFFTLIDVTENNWNSLGKVFYNLEGTILISVDVIIEPDKVSGYIYCKKFRDLIIEKKYEISELYRTEFELYSDSIVDFVTNELLKL